MKYTMRTINPYDAPATTHNDAPRPGMLRAAIAFSLVLTVAVVGGAIAPSVAHFAGAPSDFTGELLRVSMITCIPFGIMVAYATARCVQTGSCVSRLYWYFGVLLIVIPLAIYPKTAGPLVDYTGFALVLTVVAALVVSVLMRRFARPVSL